jgi:hypothetical protein
MGEAAQIIIAPVQGWEVTYHGWRYEIHGPGHLVIDVGPVRREHLTLAPQARGWEIATEEGDVLILVEDGECPGRFLLYVGTIASWRLPPDFAVSLLAWGSRLAGTTGGESQGAPA